MFCQFFIEIFIRCSSLRTSLLCLEQAKFRMFTCTKVTSTADQREGLYHLPDYVVTASRVPQSIDQLSPSVSLISTQDLERSQWHSLSDLLLQL